MRWTRNKRNGRLRIKDKYDVEFWVIVRNFDHPLFTSKNTPYIRQEVKKKHRRIQNGFLRLDANRIRGEREDSRCGRGLLLAAVLHLVRAVLASPPSPSASSPSVPGWRPVSATSGKHLRRRKRFDHPLSVFAAASSAAANPPAAATAGPTAAPSPH